MAFGKKKDESAPGEPVNDSAGEPTDGLAGAFAAAAEAADEEAPAGLQNVQHAAPEAEEPASADALLSVFQNSDDNEDRSVLLELAGDVEIHELLEQLKTAAAAVGRMTRRRAA